MRSGPNNYPREGEHNPVIAKAIDGLLQRRGELEHLQKYTLGEDAEVSIQAARQAADTYEYNRGCRILEGASQRIRHETDRVLSAAPIDIDAIEKEADEHLAEEFQRQVQSLSP